MHVTTTIGEHRPSGWLAAYTLAEREVTRFVRQRSRLIGALAQPILFWVLFGAGLHGSFSTPGSASFQEYFFPGVAVMIVLFTAIFATISLIEDRREGFLQGVLASPAPRWAIVAGKVGGGAFLAFLQAMLFLALGPLLAQAGLTPPVRTGLTMSNVVVVAAFVAALGCSLTALGYVIAWQMQSVQGFHAIMSVVLMPMWLLSGALFPVSGASAWLALMMQCNPLTYGVAALRRLMAGPELEIQAAATDPSLAFSVAVTLLFGAVCLTAATLLTRRRTVINVA